MHLSRRAKKLLAAAAAIIVLFFILTSPKYHSGAPDIDLNRTSDYYEIYYGNGTSASLAETWMEFHNPADLFAYYYCEKRAGLQVGAFIVGDFGEEINPAEGTSSSSGGIDVPCFGFISPIAVRGELDPYGHALRVCYGFRLAERTGCFYG